jgi:hypothetical protein
MAEAGSLQKSLFFRVFSVFRGLNRRFEDELSHEYRCNLESFLEFSEESGEIFSNLDV